MLKTTIPTGVLIRIPSLSYLAFCFFRTAAGSPIKEEGWATALARETSKPYFGRLQTFLDKQYASKTIYPPREKLFNAFESCPLGDVKVCAAISWVCRPPPPTEPLSEGRSLFC